MFNLPAWTHDELRSMAQHSDWHERGGRAIREAGQYQTGGKVIGRTVWVGKPEWARGFRYTPAEWLAIVDKAIAGKHLGRMQKIAVESMLRDLEVDELDQRWGKMTRDEQERGLDEIFGADTNPDHAIRAAAKAAGVGKETPGPLSLAAQKEAAPSLRAGAASPATPCKAPQHFREGDRPDAASARIYLMPKLTVKRAPGRPPFGDKAMRKVLVPLDEASIARAKKIGQGNMAAGIRKALARRQSG